MKAVDDDLKSEMERLVSNLAPSKQAEVRFFIENLLEQERKRLLETHTVKEVCPCKKYKEKYPLGVLGGGGNDPLIIMSINCKVCDAETPKEEKECEDCPRGSHFIDEEEPATPEKKDNLQDMVKQNIHDEICKEKGCCDYCIGGGDHLRCPCHKKKEEPTTPEKCFCGNSVEDHEAYLSTSSCHVKATPEKKCCENCLVAGIKGTIVECVLPNCFCHRGESEK